jgi:hypothetical protein
MQLNVLRHRLLTLLFLSVCATPAVTGVLPDDRTDALYHRYQGGGITIQGPSILVQKKITDNFAVNGNWYQDYISSASIDVKLNASPYKEKRTQESAGFQYLHGKSTYSAGFIHSVEPDYNANTTYYSVSQDMFGDLTTFSMTYKRGWDKVYRDLKQDGQIVNDPSFGGFDKDGNPISFKDADHRGYSVGLSQILTRTIIGNFNYEVLTDQGYLQSPYRQILFLTSGDSKGFSLANQIYPNTRTSNAGSIQLKYYAPWRAAVTPIRRSRNGYSTAPSATTRRMRPASTVTCFRGPISRTSWRATASSRHSTATRSAWAPPTTSRFHAIPGSTAAASRSVSITC